MSSLQTLFGLFRCCIYAFRGMSIRIRGLLNYMNKPFIKNKKSTIDVFILYSWVNKIYKSSNNSGNVGSLPSGAAPYTLLFSLKEFFSFEIWKIYSLSSKII